MSICPWLGRLVNSAGAKAALIIALLQREEGATLAEMPDLHRGEIGSRYTDSTRRSAPHQNMRFVDLGVMPSRRRWRSHGSERLVGLTEPVSRDPALSRSHASRVAIDDPTSVSCDIHASETARVAGDGAKA